MAPRAYDERYMPILTGKVGEVEALGQLRRRLDVAPVFDVPPIPQAADPSRRAAAAGRPPPVPPTLAGRTRTLANAMATHWESGQRFYVDLRAVSSAEAPDGGPAIDYVFGVLRAAGLRPAPCLSVAAGGAEVAAVARIAADAPGVCLRVPVDRSPDATDRWLTHTMRALRVVPAQVAVLLDVGAVTTSTTSDAAGRAAAHLSLWGARHPWSLVSVASTSAPAKLTGPLWREAFPRLELELWRDLADRALLRPAFGDYGITGPRPDTQAPSRRAAPALRYSTADAWMVWKGKLRPPPVEGIEQDGRAQFDAFCADLVTWSGYARPGASWGDAELAERAALSDRPSAEVAPTRAIAFTTNHHLERTVEAVVL